ncbi:MAG: Xaa-Pro peptidase family protein [Chloroflexota bacterium]|nr:Xaa-Pro peptidase family protein [Chloroflexota bacterium]
MLTRQGCQQRQTRLLQYMHDQQIDIALLSDPCEIYYFSGVWLPGYYPAWTSFPGLFVIFANGTSWLFAHTDEGEALASERHVYEWNLLYTTHPDPARRLSVLFEARLRGMAHIKRVGWQAETLSHDIARKVQAQLAPDEWIALDDALQAMQARKDADEIACIRESARINLAGIDAARQVIAPGVNELDVLAAGQRGAMRAAGRVVRHVGDYACGVMGGAARDRQIESGELYILDTQTLHQGYWSDLARVFPVDGTLTAIQQEVYDHVAAILREMETLLKPGVHSSDVTQHIDRQLRQHPLLQAGLIHHGGHGTGLRAHEAYPDVNKERGAVLEVGNVICVEPGGYTAQARAGVRLENTFLITADGCEVLSEFGLAVGER